MTEVAEAQQRPRKWYWSERDRDTWFTLATSQV